MMLLSDKDKDGHLDVKELRAMGFDGSDEDLRKHDADKDGKLSKSELTLLWKSMDVNKEADKSLLETTPIRRRLRAVRSKLLLFFEENTQKSAGITCSSLCIVLKKSMISLTVHALLYGWDLFATRRGFLPFLILSSKNLSF